MMKPARRQSGSQAAHITLKVTRLPVTSYLDHV